MKLSCKKLDVVIPVARKDTAFVRHVVTHINKYVTECEHIYIVTNKKNFSRLKHLDGISNVELLDENGLVPELSFGIVHECMKRKGEKRPNCVGWYFQQLLKFAFAKSKWAKGYYLTWDADTLPLNPVSFFDGDSPLFTKKIENHEPYFLTMNRILGFGKLVDYSFIAEHMVFKASIVKEMLEAIEDYPKSEGKTWVEKIMYACDFSDKRGSLFSEFETYGNYCVKYHPDLYGTRQLNTFRAAGLIRGRHITDKILTRLGMDVVIASFEQQDAPFPYNISWYMKRVKNKLRNMGADLLGGGKIAITIELPYAENCNYQICA